MGALEPGKWTLICTLPIWVVMEKFNGRSAEAPPLTPWSVARTVSWGEVNGFEEAFGSLIVS